MNNWKEVELKEVLNFRRGFDLPKIRMQKGIIPVVASNGIIGYHNVHTCFKPCITIGRSGNIGTPFYYEEDCWAHNTTLYVEDFKENYPKYLYYILKTIKFKNYSSGSAVPTLNRNHISNISIKFTSNLEEQKAIAQTLSCLDEKIELNNKINKNLEKMAQAIFKKWFIDFDYPLTDEEKANGGREFIDSELGKIPKGWKVVELGEVTTQIKDKIGEKENYKVLSAINTGNLILSEEYFNKQVFSKDISKYLDVKLYDFAYNPSRINIGSLGINRYNFNCCVSPIYVVFRVQELYHNFFDILLKTNRIKEEINVRCNGSVRQALNYKDFAIIKVVYPHIDTICKFNNIYNIILEKSKFNNKQNEKLIQIRDTLLPKLINGEIRITY